MSSYKIMETPGDTSWLIHDRFGMFIHFGLYAMHGRGEWALTKELIPAEKYDVYFKYFNPDLLDIKKWAKAAKDAGMKYAVLTAKHHDGFCLFDSEYTDYKATNTPLGRDIIKEYTDAFRAEGIKVGIYYSIIDWHHPEFIIDRIHPLREHPDAEEMSKKRDMKKYNEYMRNQVKELLTNYGKIDILWFDYVYPHPEARDLPWMKGKGAEDFESEKLINLAREINPDIIINSRAGIFQDTMTPEQHQPLEWPKNEETGEYYVWEACQTFSGGWGYKRDELTWKSPKMLLNLLINNVSLGGNLLMNVGPDGRGEIYYRAMDALKVFGEWMKYNSRSIYGCTMAEPEFIAPLGTRLTQSEDGKRLYIHLIEYPFKHIKMKDLADKIEYAQFLHDGSEILFHSSTEKKVHTNLELGVSDNEIVFNIPPVQPNVITPVIEVFLK